MLMVVADSAVRTYLDSKHFPFPMAGYFDPNSDGRKFVLNAPFVFKDGDEEIIVPAGSVTDFNSVPWGLWNLMPPWKHYAAGLVHDHLYKHPGGRSRRKCDDTHRRILDLLGVNWFNRQMYWSGIRAGGWRSWNRYRKEDRGK